MKERIVERVIQGQPSSDGAGVKLSRSLGQSQFARLDPFLMLDEFRSDESADYMAGFPSHPHRGFETVTYMLAGAMKHKDSLGNAGTIRAGDIQWMTAASGIIHSEMPEQQAGEMHGFQLWINLPASEKMKAPRYQDIAAERIPELRSGDVTVRVITGEAELGGETATGPVSGISTEPLYLDVVLAPGATFSQALPSGLNGLVYVYEGEVQAGSDGFSPVVCGNAGLLSSGDAVTLEAGSEGASLLLLAAKSVREPVVQHGPFVMNTRDEIEQAIRDYQQGRFAAEPVETP
ncbi:hypothetical protein DES49_0140 [Halospina denitrificans]|uniref:Quercetin 2,3-dioxygenase n=1 Tax=Halospina denitrificans TaxID=332522 RepID=A0A4R7JZR9_9GAMM|nr:pirin family protein [Halospina denitrificans]TDT44041.1 hypothetical protein DES49_0140 [Halospina denitrificans]